MLLIKNGLVLDPLTKTQERLDLLIDRGNIAKISKEIPIDTSWKVIDASNWMISPGLIDIHSHFRDPGFTHKEDILTGARSAARGGYTTVVCMANTNPVIDKKEVLEYIYGKAKNAKIEVLSVASITKGMKGMKLTDMKALRKAGAVGFSDDGKPILDSKLVYDAMKIARELDVPLSFHEEDPTLISENGINSDIAESFNLRGSPPEAEEVLVARDAILAISTKAKVNIQHISSAVSVEIVRWAKEQGANIWAEVTPHHFSLDQKALLKHGPNAKMNPPLRQEKDRIALIEGLKDNTIEIIATDHAPHAFKEKEVDIQKAPSGIIGLETALALGITNLVKKGHLTVLELIEKLTINPARLYNLDRGYIKEGMTADLVIFDPKEEWIVGEFESKSQNSPFKNSKLCGKVKYTISKGEIVYESNGTQDTLQ